MTVLGDQGTAAGLARSYARRKWPVFPVHGIDDDGVCRCRKGESCDRPGKHPRTRNGLKDGTVDERDVALTWRKWPSANVGVVTGGTLVVLDVDPGHGGESTLAELEKEHGALPSTMQARTGGGGRHLYFSTAEPIPCSVGTKTAGLGVGLDVRGEGGYVVAPPSRHASGGSYSWLEDSADEPVEIPEWLAKMARKPQLEAAAGISDGDVSFFIKGQRATHLTQMAGSLRARGMVPSVILTTLLAENASRNRPPIGVDEIKRLVKSAQKWPPHPNRPTAKRNDDDPDWYTQLKTADKGALRKSPGNAAVILANDERWRGVLRYDAFADRINWMSKPPEGGGVGRPSVGNELKDVDLTYVAHWLAMTYGPDFSRESVAASVELAARDNTIHPVKAYLSGLTWDMNDRLGTWLHRYLKAEDCEYHSAIGLWWMISAVARVMRPGCQVDHMLVLEGLDQGEGKSTAGRVLGGDWSLGSLPDIRNKDVGHNLQGNWIIEVGELDAIRGANATRVKDFLTQVIDVYRPSYGRFFVRRPRQCVFLATTNDDTYLTDPSGARRFWPCRTRGLDRAALVRDRDQLWAEAVHRFKDGERWWPTADVAPLLNEQAEARAVIDTWENRISEWLSVRKWTTSYELLNQCIGIDIIHIQKRDEMRLAQILQRLKWKRSRRLVNNKRTWGYIPRNQG